MEGLEAGRVSTLEGAELSDCWRGRRWRRDRLRDCRRWFRADGDLPGAVPDALQDPFEADVDDATADEEDGDDRAACDAEGLLVGEVCVAVVFRDLQD
jgi:hypothetical protein